MLAKVVVVMVVRDVVEGETIDPIFHEKFGHHSYQLWLNFGKHGMVSHSTSTETPTPSPSSQTMTISREEFDHIIKSWDKSRASSSSHLATTPLPYLPLHPPIGLLNRGCPSTCQVLPLFLHNYIPYIILSLWVLQTVQLFYHAKGMANLTSSLIFSNVLYVPNFPFNLLSSTALTFTRPFLLYHLLSLSLHF